MQVRSESKRGSVTIEASIIVPLVILCVVALIYMAIMLYQKAYLQAEADLAAERAAAVWDNSSKNMSTGALGIGSLEDDGLYWELFDPLRQEKLDRLKYGINLKRSALHGEKYITSSIADYVVYKKLVVMIRGEYSFPGGEMLSIFGIGDKLTVRVQSEAVIYDPAEFIRNTDFLIDTGREIEREFPGLRKAGEKLREIMNSISERISKFFNE